MQNSTEKNVSTGGSNTNVIRRLSRWLKIRMLKTKMYNLDCDMMFFAIPFSQYEKEMEAYQNELECLSNGV
jgi:hypothetical protein